MTGWRTDGSPEITALSLIRRLNIQIGRIPEEIDGIVCAGANFLALDACDCASVVYQATARDPGTL
jgi:hypothetical protein